MKKNILFILLLLTLITACTKESPFIDEGNGITERELQPFAAWLRAHSSTTRSSDHSEVSELLDNEKKLFETKFAYIHKYFKISLSPRWNAPKIIRHNEEAFDLFVLCDNMDIERRFLNDFVLIISKRGSQINSYIKMLPGDESINNRLIATYEKDKVYFELEQTEVNGLITVQRLGYLIYSETATTRCNCRVEIHPITTRYLVLDREGGGGYGYSITRYESKLVCDGTIDGITPPSPAAGAGGIPPYSPPVYPSPSTDGSNGNGGSSGGNNSGGSNGSYNGAGYGTGTGGSYGGGTGSNSGGPGGSGGSGCPECDKPIPDLPPGGVDFIPPPEYKDPYATIKKRYAEEMPKLMEEVTKHIQMPDNLEVVLAENCLVNARVVDGRLEVCYSFFANENLTDKDRVAVIYHEVYHIKNDKPTEMAKKRIDPIRLDPPAEFKEFIMKYLIVPSDYDSFSKSIKKEMINNDYNTIITFLEIASPIYYENEINAYNSEIQTITDVSPYYKTMREYKLWENKELYKISTQKYYNQ